VGVGGGRMDCAGSLERKGGGVGFHDARINCEALALDETCIHARSDHRLEHLTEDVAISKAAVAIDRERRMIRNLVFEFKTAEPAIAEMKFDLLAQPPLEADAIAVADDEHSDHQLRIDRGSTDVAVERRQLLAKVGQHPSHNWIDAAQEMIRGNVFFEVEKIEQLALINRLTTHHDLRPSLKASDDGIMIRQYSRRLFQQHRPERDMRSSALPQRNGDCAAKWAGSEIGAAAVSRPTRPCWTA